jgi:hypothetical protein
MGDQTAQPVVGALDVPEVSGAIKRMEAGTDESR